MSVPLDQYLGIFIDETRENLIKLNESILALESDYENLEILNDIFRVAHTLKGMAATMGFNDMAELTHHMENVLEPLRNNTLKANTSVIDVLFKCLDSLEKLLDKIVTGNTEQISIQELVSDLQNLLNDNLGAQAVSNIAKAVNKANNAAIFDEYERSLIENAITDGYKVTEIKVILDDDCLLPSARAYMVVKAVEDLGEIFKSIPNVEDLEKGNFSKEFYLYIITKFNDDEVIKVVNTITEIKEVKAKEFSLDEQGNKASSFDTSTINIEVEALKGRLEPSNNEEEPVLNGYGNKSQKKDNSGNVYTQTIRISAEKLDKLMNLVGEMVISRTRIAQISNEGKYQDLPNTIESMGYITGEIQEIVMKLRMVPIDQVFNRFPRLVRDLSKNLNKQVNLVLTGKETEIDKAVVDELSDPLVHLIRNCLDHGFETPEERIEQSKPAKGTLELAAYNEGDNIVITISDDGRGINHEKIRQHAVEKGILSKEEAKLLSENEAIDLIFAPGFSTAKVTSDISGRGVGLDVVRSKIKELRGIVSISTKVGVGTKFTIILPSSIAIVQALLIKVGEESYAVPLNHIVECIQLHNKDIMRVQNHEVIVLRNKTLPLIRLNKVFGVTNYKVDKDTPLAVIIVRSKDKNIGIVATDLLGQQEIVIKPIDKSLCSEDYLSGTTILGNGKVALIINVNGLSNIF